MLIIWQRPLSGLLAGFILGQILSFGTWAIDDCVTNKPYIDEDKSSIKLAPYHFFSLWGQFIAQVLKHSIIGFGVVIGGLIIITLIIYAIFYGL